MLFRMILASVAGVSLVMLPLLALPEGETAATDRTHVGPGPAVWQEDLAPIAAADWSYDRAAHLLERAGFGGTPEEIARLAAMTPAEAVQR